jgi:hypothetical protein
VSAYPYDTFGAVCLNLEWQLEGVPELSVITAFIEAYRLANLAFMDTPLTEGRRNDILKRLTGCVVGTLNNVNCYPLGYATAQLFDLDGNPIP